MDTLTLIALFVLGGGVLLLLLFAFIRFWIDYRFDIEYVKIEMRRSSGWDEYVFWRRELRALRWCIIPGLSLERVKTLQRKWEQRKKKRKNHEDDGLLSMMIPSLLGISLCAACLVGSTFAWFTATQNVTTINIDSAKYDIYTHITEGQSSITPQNGVYTLEKGKTYHITLSPTPDSTATTGYCIVYLNGEVLAHTIQFPSSVAEIRELSFTLTPQTDTTLSIEPQWGTSAWNDDEKIIQDASLPYPSDDVP